MKFLAGISACQRIKEFYELLMAVTPVATAMNLATRSVSEK
jgi:hypothetical protein